MSDCVVNFCVLEIAHLVGELRLYLEFFGETFLKLII